MKSLVGFIGKTGPLKSLTMFEVIAFPTLPSLSVAPITAIEHGERIE